jgi:hypothetical protein
MENAPGSAFLRAEAVSENVGGPLVATKIGRPPARRPCLQRRAFGGLSMVMRAPGSSSASAPPLAQAQPGRVGYRGEPGHRPPRRVLRLCRVRRVPTARCRACARWMSGLAPLPQPHSEPPLPPNAGVKQIASLSAADEAVAERIPLVTRLENSQGPDETELARRTLEMHDARIRSLRDDAIDALIVLWHGLDPTRNRLARESERKSRGKTTASPADQKDHDHRPQDG